MSERLFACLVLILVASVLGHGSARMDTDVLHYTATLEPDIAGKSVKGSVLIRFSTTATVVALDCGELTIDAVRAAGAPLQFSVNNRRLTVSLPSEKRVRLFTRRHFGKSVVTADFIAAMEQAHGKSLKEFFTKWVLSAH